MEGANGEGCCCCQEGLAALREIPSFFAGTQLGGKVLGSVGKASLLRRDSQSSVKIVSSGVLNRETSYSGWPCGFGFLGGFSVGESLPSLTPIFDKFLMAVTRGEGKLEHERTFCSSSSFNPPLEMM